MDSAGSAVRELSGRTGLSRVGRDGELRLRFERRGDSTVLRERYFKTPLQCLEPLPEPDGSVCVMLLNPTGGVLGGDRLRTEMQLGPGAHVSVTTPSATRIYRSAGAPSCLGTDVRLGDGAVLEYVPDHVIPHAGAWLEQALRIEATGAARAVLWDAIAVGRIARGERWVFHRLDSRIELQHDGRPVFLDRFVLEGTRRELQGRGGMDKLGYVGTLVAFDPAFDAWDALAEELHARLGSPGPLRGGAGRLAGPGCMARILAPSAHELVSAFLAAWALVRHRLFGLPPLDLRKP